MHLSMLSQRRGGGGRANNGNLIVKSVPRVEFSILSEFLWDGVSNWMGGYLRILCGVLSILSILIGFPVPPCHILG